MNGAGAALTAAAAVLRELASVLEALPAQATTPMPSSGSEPLPWPALLWIVPPETRIGRSELLAATGRPKSWLYRHTGKAGRCPRIPHRRVDGELVFVVGELRAWLVQHEVVVVPASPALRVVERARP